jgi:riboflavin kinase
MQKKSLLDLLIGLLSMGGAEKFITLSTSEIAYDLGISQQTASRWLIEFEKDGLIERKHFKIKLTEKATRELRALYLTLKGTFERKLHPVFTGVVTSGLRDGEYYISLANYRKQIKEKLGFTPFPGTLNIRIDEPENRMLLEREEGARIRSFEIGKRFFGGAKCLPALINKKIRGAVIIPNRTHYGPDILEIIAKENLRKKLNLKDGSRVTIDVVNK